MRGSGLTVNTDGVRPQWLFLLLLVFSLLLSLSGGRRETKPAFGASGGEKVQIDNVTTTICTSKPKVDIRGHYLDRVASSLKYGDEASRCRTTVARSFLPALLQFHPEPPVLSEPRYLRF